MVKWTTPSIKCTIPEGLEFDYILMTVKQSDYIIEKGIYPEQVEDNAFTVFFTQEETSGFQLFAPIEVQLNVMKGGVRIATNINQLCIERNLHDDEIGETPTPAILEITENGMYDVANYTFANVNIEVPTRTSQLINDSGFITSSDVPTKTSQLINNSNFQTDVDVEQSISIHNESAISHLDIRQLVSTEVANRESADTGLQSQIDALTSASDVTDIVGTYQELEEYDTSSLTNNDIIVVLDDSTHNNTKSYYRWDSEQEEFNYVGSDGEYYTKSVVDSLFVPQTRQVNGHALSSDITLTYQDVGALSDTTHIPNKQDIKNVIDDEMAVMKYVCLVNGIEQLLPTNTSVPTTTPLLADIQYPDELRNNQYFNYRTSPTTSDGEAKIKKIKGNSVVFNQLNPDNFSDLSKWKQPNGAFGTLSISNNILTSVVTSTPNTSYSIAQETSPSLINEHKYLFFCDVYSSVQTRCRFLYSQIANNTEIKIIPANVWTTYYSVVTMTQTITNSNFYINTYGNLAVDDTLQFKNWNIIDLTLLNDSRITDYDTFKQYYPLSYYDYNVGSLLSFNGTGIDVKSPNMLNLADINKINAGGTIADFNGSYTFNGMTISVDADKGEMYLKGTPTSSWFVLQFEHIVNLIYGKTYTGSITLSGTRGGNFYCRYQSRSANNTMLIGLGGVFVDTSHTDTFRSVTSSLSDSDVVQSTINFEGLTTGAYYDLTIKLQVQLGDTYTDFEPYKETTTSLPTSTYFPTGMKSAGSVYDELTENKAITRVGVVDLSTLSYTLSGSNWRTGANAVADMKKPADNSTPINALSTYTIKGGYYVQNENEIGCTTDGIIYVNNGSTTTTPTGYLYYELNDEVIVDLPQYSDLTELAENVTSEYIILRDANNVKYKVSVDTNGNLIATPI